MLVLSFLPATFFTKFSILIRFLELLAQVTGVRAITDEATVLATALLAIALVILVLPAITVAFAEVLWAEPRPVIGLSGLVPSPD